MDAANVYREERERERDIVERGRCRVEKKREEEDFSERANGGEKIKRASSGSVRERRKGRKRETESDGGGDRVRKEQTGGTWSLSKGETESMRREKGED